MDVLAQREPEIESLEKQLSTMRHYVSQLSEQGAQVILVSKIKLFLRVWCEIRLLGSSFGLYL